MSEYYVVKPGTTQTYGPLTEEQIRMGVEQGAITPDYCYCEDGASEWKPIKELIGSPSATLPPIPINSTALNNADKPKDCMALSITSLCLSILFGSLCCPALLICLTLSIIATVKSTSVDQLFIQGRIEEANKASKVAYRCGIWSLIIGILSFIIFIIILFLPFLGEIMR